MIPEITAIIQPTKLNEDIFGESEMLWLQHFHWLWCYHNLLIARRDRPKEE
jgi:hypothetical protein